MNLEKANRRLDKIEQNTTDTTTAMITYSPQQHKWLIEGEKRQFATLSAAEEYLDDTTEPKTVIVDDLAYYQQLEEKQTPQERI